MDPNYDFYNGEPWYPNSSVPRVSYSDMMDNTNQRPGTTNTITANTQFGDQIAELDELVSKKFLCDPNSSGLYYPNTIINSIPGSYGHHSSSHYGSLVPATSATHPQGVLYLNAPTGSGIAGHAAHQRGHPSPRGDTIPSNTDFSSGSFQPVFIPLQHPAVPIPTEPSRPNSKIYACSFGCGKSFGRKGDMERHAKSHGPRTLRCNFAGCGKHFYRKDKLGDHSKIHTTH